MNNLMNSTMPFLYRLVIAAAMVTTGWFNCFGFVEVSSAQVTTLQELDIQVRQMDKGGETTTQTTRGLHRIVLLLHDEWPQLGGWGKLLAWTVSVFELLAGVLLFVGLFSRLSAFVVCVILGMALYLVSYKINGMFTMNPFDWPLHKEAFAQLFTEMSLIVLAFAIVVGGPGCLSIDRFHASSLAETRISSVKRPKRGDD
jgi:uncharacterized membrane protein YphA (DoxX/SURF4 family)